ncbi:hypothetical protein JCM10450v2_005121 [Rhodotorula kratochvilovae]
MPALAPPPPPRQGCAAEDTLSLAEAKLLCILTRQNDLLKTLQASAVIRATDLDALFDLQVAATRAAQIVCRAGNELRAGDELRAQQAQNARKVILALEAKQQGLVRENAALRGALAPLARNRMRGEAGMEQGDAT